LPSCNYAGVPRTVDDLFQRLTAAIQDAEQLLPRLSALLPEPDGTGPATGTIGRHKPSSDEPWNTAAADAYWNLWFGTSKLVDVLRYALDLPKLPETETPKGPDALRAIRNLTPAAPDEMVRYAVRKLERWADLARRIPAIDESEPWTPVPAVKGNTPPECPYCGTFGLRMQRRRGAVRCVMPGCRDGDGNSTRARMEPGRMTGEARLVFGDGTTMHWSGDDDIEGHAG
jgi:hypothetical protein